MHDQAGRLVQHDQVGILVQDGERDGLRRGEGGNRSGLLQAVACPDADRFGRIADHVPVPQHRRFQHQGLDA